MIEYYKNKFIINLLQYQLMKLKFKNILKKII